MINNSCCKLLGKRKCYQTIPQLLLCVPLMRNMLPSISHYNNRVPNLLITLVFLARIENYQDLFIIILLYCIKRNLYNSCRLFNQHFSYILFLNKTKCSTESVLSTILSSNLRISLNFNQAVVLKGMVLFYPSLYRLQYVQRTNRHFKRAVSYSGRNMALIKSSGQDWGLNL